MLSLRACSIPAVGDSHWLKWQIFRLVKNAYLRQIFFCFSNYSTFCTFFEGKRTDVFYRFLSLRYTLYSEMEKRFLLRLSIIGTKHDRVVNASDSKTNVISSHVFESCRRRLTPAEMAKL